MRVIIESEDEKMTVTVQPPAAAATHPEVGIALTAPTELLAAAAGLVATDAGPAPQELQRVGAPVVATLSAAGDAQRVGAQLQAIDAGPMPAELMALGEPTGLTTGSEQGLSSKEAGDTAAGPAPGNPPVSGASSAPSRKVPG